MTNRDLIVVDSLKAATGGQDENSSEIRSALDMLGSVGDEVGCRPMLLHHSRKPSQDPSASSGGQYAIRGSGAIFDAVDSAYTFASERNEPVVVEMVKARTHGEVVASFALLIEDVPSEDGSDARAGVRVSVFGVEAVEEVRALKKRVAAERQAREDAKAVRAVIAVKPGINATDLAAAANMSHRRVTCARIFLGDDVVIREEKAGRAYIMRHYLNGVTP
jgi:hypothetical protein